MEGLAAALKVDVNEGLNPGITGDTSVESRQTAFGVNRCRPPACHVPFCCSGESSVIKYQILQLVVCACRFKAVPLKSFFALLLGNLQDPTLILLMVAALVSLL